ncbi:gluconokinase [Georgenia sp. Z1491]|uniref:gluconokinase n=1 Tax=Georgenia sp. Z1491 TaxID=3416707 RepID=UPI003CF9BC9D
MSDAFRTTLADADRPLVLSVDIGSTASRAGLYDAAGRPLRDARQKVSHTFTTDVDGTSTIDADQVVAEVSEVVGAVTDAVPEGGIAGVGLDSFAASLVGVDATGKAVTPCYTYADSRCAPRVAELRTKLGESELQQRTGTRLHTSYLAPRLRWLRDTEPELFAAVDRWMSLPEYVHLRLLGVAVASTPAASWTGLLNRRTGEWDTQLLRLSGIRRAQLSPVQDPAVAITPTPGAASSVARTWPALADAQWFPGIPDGLGSSLGAGGTGSSTAVLSASTTGAMRLLVETIPATLPPGLWGYRVDDGHSLLGGALSDVGSAVTWLRENIRVDDDLDDVLGPEPVSSTPLVLPFLSGERSTGWSAGALGTVLGISAAHTPTDLARGLLEGVALSYARVAKQLREVAGMPSEIRVSGGVIGGVPGFAQLLADVLGAPVTPVTYKRTTMRGTALLALRELAPDVDRAVGPLGERCEPVPARTAHYARRLAQLEDAYAAVTPL